MKNFFLKIWNGIRKAASWVKDACVKVCGWVRHDGLDHIAVSAILLVALGWARPLWVPGVFVLCIGLIKELYDRFNPGSTAEWHDIVCDVIGIALGYLIVFINFLGQR